MSKVGSNYFYLEAILFNFVLKKKYKNYYPQVLSKESKYIKKEKRKIRHISDDVDIFSDDFDKE